MSANLNAQETNNAVNRNGGIAAGLAYIVGVLLKDIAH